MTRRSQRKATEALAQDRFGLRSWRNWRRSALVPLLAGVAVEGSACAMTKPQPQALSCSVRNADKLPPALGGADAVCAAISRAAAPVLDSGRAAGAAVEVTVVSDHQLKAAASLDGKALPEQNVGISDRPLNARALDMLANAIAAQLSKAAT